MPGPTEVTEVREARDNEVGAPDAKGATERQVERIEEIHGSEVLGYQGEARGEHSGEKGGRPLDATEDMADNKDAPRYGAKNGARGVSLGNRVPQQVAAHPRSFAVEACPERAKRVERAASETP